MNRNAFIRKAAGLVAGAAATPLTVGAIEATQARGITLKSTEHPRGYQNIPSLGNMIAKAQEEPSPNVNSWYDTNLPPVRERPGTALLSKLVKQSDEVSAAHYNQSRFFDGHVESRLNQLKSVSPAWRSVRSYEINAEREVELNCLKDTINHLRRKISDSFGRNLVKDAQDAALKELNNVIQGIADSFDSDGAAK